MSTRGAEAIASIAASMSERETLRAVSSTLTWSAASEVSNSLWSSENSGSAVAVPVTGAACMRRYSSRAAPWSSGKPSKPSACAKRTTVELDVLARRASSSAVWKAASSRWSTMYWPTSFCERENSSKRLRISEERVSADVPDRVTRNGFARPGGVPSGEVGIGGHAAVHEERGAGHVVGLGAREPRDGGGDLLGPAEAPQRGLGRHRLPLARVVDEHLVDGRQDRARRHVHHADPVARQLLGDRLREQLHPALAGAVVRVLLPRDLLVHARDVPDRAPEPRLDHPPRRLARAEESAGQVHVDHAL